MNVEGSGMGGKITVIVPFTGVKESGLPLLSDSEVPMPTLLITTESAMTFVFGLTKYETWASPYVCMGFTTW
jgi:hypothetical protein